VPCGKRPVFLHGYHSLELTSCWMRLAIVLVDCVCVVLERPTLLFVVAVPSSASLKRSVTNIQKLFVSVVAQFASAAAYDRLMSKFILARLAAVQISQQAGALFN